MKKFNKVKFWCGLAEIVFAGLAVGSIWEQSHPAIPSILLVLARASAYSKSFFEGEKQNPQQNEGG